MNRLIGTWLFLRAIFSTNIVILYKWLAYVKNFVVPDAEEFFVQGVWDKWPEVNPAIRQMEILFEADSPQPGDMILDVGCGYGGFAGMCRKRFPEVKSIIGVDINKNHTKEAEKKFGELPGVSFITGDVTEIISPDNPGFSGSAFDKIYLNEISPELSPDSFDKIVHSCYRLLSPGGSMILFTLTVDAKPKTWLEQTVADMTVRRGAPNRVQIEGSLERAGLKYTRKDLTDVSSARLVERFIADPSISSAILLWPFSGLLYKIIKSSKDILDREGTYAVSLYHAVKNKK